MVCCDYAFLPEDSVGNRSPDLDYGKGAYGVRSDGDVGNYHSVNWDSCGRSSPKDNSYNNNHTYWVAENGYVTSGMVTVDAVTCGRYIVRQKKWIFRSPYVDDDVDVYCVRSDGAIDISDTCFVYWDSVGIYFTPSKNSHLALHIPTASSMRMMCTMMAASATLCGGIPAG